jgi:hypothetical protein
MLTDWPRLTYAQSETAEQMLWWALQALKIRGELEDTMKLAAEVANDEPRAASYRRRCAESKRAAQILEKILAELATGGTEQTG